MSISIARRETNWKFFSTTCSETEDLNQRVDNVKDVVNQSSFVQYNHEIEKKKVQLKIQWNTRLRMETKFI